MDLWRGIEAGVSDSAETLGLEIVQCSNFPLCCRDSGGTSGGSVMAMEGFVTSFPFFMAMGPYGFDDEAAPCGPMVGVAVGDVAALEVSQLHLLPDLGPAS